MLQPNFHDQFALFFYYISLFWGSMKTVSVIYSRLLNVSRRRMGLSMELLQMLRGMGVGL